MNVLGSDRFRTWITCAAYALLNTLEDQTDLIELENSTGVTFGISSAGDEYFCARMLTPFTSFWDGVTNIEKIWGIRIRQYRFRNSGEVFDMMNNSPPIKMMIGPINMMTLDYLPFSSQYKFVDHYISVEKTDRGDYLITDSEGIYKMKTALDKLCSMLTVEGIPEANGSICVGSAEYSDNELSKEERLDEILLIAKDNYYKAERSNEGGNAFLKCLNVMESVPKAQWRMSFIYDLNYYIQRKYMLMSMKARFRPGLSEHIQKQSNLAARVRQTLLKNTTDDITAAMNELAYMETTIAKRWKDRVIFG